MTRKPPHKSRKPKEAKGKPSPRRGRVPERSQAPARPQRIPTHVVGLIIKASYGWGLQSTDRKEKSEYVIRNPSDAEAHAGELVVAEILPSSKFGRREVKITHHLGQPDDARNVSLIAIHTHQIPDTFNDAAVREADAAKPVTLVGRTDLRAIPFVTIDGADARDFDDAVFAEPHKNGWHLAVAIADVAHYVRHDSALDKTAYERGNSTYFADRVVPMLPEALSNELCSLKPLVDRACMAVHMWLDKAGELTRWEFVRGVMKSRARLTYEQAQAAMDGKTDSITAPLVDSVLKPLYGAYDCLIKARVKRGTLELDLPERKVELGDDGLIKNIGVRTRLDSHKLIEEFMIMANVAAAAQLEGPVKPSPSLGGGLGGGEPQATAFGTRPPLTPPARTGGGFCLYRIHDKPNEIKLTALRDFLDSLGISLVPAKQLHPRMLTQILEQAAGGPHAQVVNEVMLRSQAQAVYSPDNIGHFGLALAKYAHFTSPIRRYADLVVHRGLIRACNLGDDGLTDHEIKHLSDIGEHISATERRSAMAEREVMDRFTTLFLADKVGALFKAKISGVARFGLFARLDDSGADGIIPFSSLPQDYYNYDEKRQAMIGQRHGRTYQLATPVTVRLATADKLTGSMSFAIVEEGEKPASGKKNGHRGRR